MSTPRKGFTLLELLITLTISSTLLLIAVPAFSSLIASTRINNIYQQLFHTLQYTRSKAVFTNTQVILCPSKDQVNCVNEWHLPLIVFSDKNSNQQRDDEEIIERTFTYPLKAETIVWRASGSTRYIRYFPDGATRSQNGRFTICPIDKDLEYAQQIVVFRTGRPRTALHGEIEEKHCNH